jgi:thymidine kinase
MPKNGELNLIIGPMFSGKTTSLIKIYKDNLKSNIKTLVINHSFDDRYNEGENNLISHDKLSIPCIYLKELRELYEDDKYFTDFECILINEGQFFKDLFQMSIVLVEKYKKKIYISGLDGDFNRKKFGEILDLIPFCDNIQKLKGKCNCGKESLFSKRITREINQISIGNSNYEPVCRKCYLKS